MIVDSSALVAILTTEADAESFIDAIFAADSARISAANFVEAAIVADYRGGPAGARDLDWFMRRANILIEPVTEEQAHIARHAYAEYGKGRHQAGLNFGDCFAYALSKTSGEPLLFKGRDFYRTDVNAALKDQ